MSVVADELLTVGEAAAVLKVSRKSVYRMVRSGRLSAWRLGEAPSSPIRIDPADLADVVVPATTTGRHRRPRS